MKQRNLFSLGVLLIIFTVIACEKEEDNVSGCTDPVSSNYNPKATEDNGSCNYYYGGRDKGQVEVGARTDTDNEYRIFIDNIYIGFLQYYFPNGFECGNPSAVGRIFDSGPHLITAKGNGDTVIREGTIYLEPQDCLQVYIEDLPLITNQGNKGNAIFWTNQDYGCGYISVNLHNVGESIITGFFYDTPSCEQTGNGGAFLNVNPGTYSFSASCSSSNWSGTITINAGSCSRMRLYR